MVGSCGATITYPHPSNRSSHASLCVRVTPPTCPPDPGPPCSGQHPQQPNDRLDRPPRQPVCLLHYWDMDCVSVTHPHTCEYTHTHIHTPQWCLTFPVQQVRHGCDEPPCLSSGELVSMSFSLSPSQTYTQTHTQCCFAAGPTTCRVQTSYCGQDSPRAAARCRTSP